MLSSVVYWSHTKYTLDVHARPVDLFTEWMYFSTTAVGESMSVTGKLRQLDILKDSEDFLLC